MTQSKELILKKLKTNGPSYLFDDDYVHMDVYELYVDMYIDPTGNTCVMQGLGQMIQAD